MEPPEARCEGWSLGVISREINDVQGEEYLMVTARSVNISHPSEWEWPQ